MARGKLFGSFVAALILCGGGLCLALSVGLPTPEIRFPAGYDKTRAEKIHAVLKDKQFKYIDGLYSHWPPAWSTTLVYDGDAKSLSVMADHLARIDGVKVRLTFAKDLAKEAGTGHGVGSWWVMYSHETPNDITLRVNLAAANIDVSQLKLTVAPDSSPAK